MNARQFSKLIIAAALLSATPSFGSEPINPWNFAPSFESIDASNFGGVWERTVRYEGTRNWVGGVYGKKVNLSRVVNGRHLHPFGQPNAHAPWLLPGGVKGRPAAFRSRIVYRIPSGQKIEVFRGRGEIPHPTYMNASRWRWRFPVGTEARIDLYDGKRLFATHTSKKVSRGIGIDNWEGDELIHAAIPAWYKSPDNCHDCHSDINKHGSLLLNDDNYYGFVRGSDGRFSWHPFKTTVRDHGRGDVVLRTGKEFVRK